MRTLEFITGHVIYYQAYTYKFQLKTTIVPVEEDGFIYSLFCPNFSYTNSLIFEIM